MCVMHIVTDGEMCAAIPAEVQLVTYTLCVFVSSITKLSTVQAVAVPPVLLLVQLIFLLC